MACMYLPT